MRLESDVARTLWDRQETDQNEGIFVSSPNAVVYIPNREIDWMIFLLASCDRNSCFVTSKQDGDEHRPMCIDVYGNEVLLWKS